MKEDDMGCKCGAKWEFIDGVLRCAACGMIAPYQPLPSYAELLKEKEHLEQLIMQLQRQINEPRQG